MTHVTASSWQHETTHGIKKLPQQMTEKHAKFSHDNASNINDNTAPVDSFHPSTSKNSSVERGKKKLHEYIKTTMTYAVHMSTSSRQ